MSLMFFEAADAVRNMLIQEEASQRIVDEHLACCNSLGAYLSEKEAESSEQQIISWLEEMKRSMSEYTVGRHRIAAYRILLYYETGSIYSGQSILGRPDYRYYKQKLHCFCSCNCLLACVIFYFALSSLTAFLIIAPLIFFKVRLSFTKPFQFCSTGFHFLYGRSGG